MNYNDTEHDIEHDFYTHLSENLYCEVCGFGIDDMSIDDILAGDLRDVLDHIDIDEEYQLGVYVIENTDVENEVDKSNDKDRDEKPKYITLCSECSSNANYSKYELYVFYADEYGNIYANENRILQGN